jgi:4a-hydroxytetrahydrobiopterin dehydratase
MSELAEQKCVPCKGGVPRLGPEEQAGLLEELDGWAIQDGHHLHKAYTFPDFVEALAFVNRVGLIAEEQGHHPDLYLTWGKVEAKIWTHKVNGLTVSDFIFAAKIDRVR